MPRIHQHYHHILQRGWLRNKIYAKPQRNRLSLGHLLIPSAPSSHHPPLVTLFLETCSPSCQAAEPAGGVQVDLHVDVRGKPTLRCILHAPPLPQPRQSNPVAKQSTELRSRTDPTYPFFVCLFSRWKIAFWEKWKHFVLGK